MYVQHDKRRVAVIMGNGHISLVEEDVPRVNQGTILVEVHNSLVSPGTELGGWKAFSQMQENSDTKPRRFGYSNAGIVLKVGEGVQRFNAGDRIACIGAGYALHADYVVVPHNLCVHLPDNVTFSQGSYAMLAATALHALRRGEPEFGEYVAVIGLGIVGQIAGQLYKLAGNFVIGWDTIALRTEIARKWGIDATVKVGSEDEVAKTKKFTDGQGLDAAVFAFGGNGNKAMKSTYQCLKSSPDGHLMGRIIVVGGSTFNYSSILTNVDIRKAGRTGPGYHDDEWETGADYPSAVVRWTTQTNLQLCMRLISERRLNVDCLTSHTIPFGDVDEGISAIISEPDKILGVIFEMI